MRRGDEGGVLSDRGQGRAKRRGIELRTAILMALAGIVLLLVVAQLLLPRIASKALRDKVAEHGEVRSASVSALPAIELLWGSAESAEVDARHLALTPTQLVSLLREAKGVERLDVTADDVKIVNPGFGVDQLPLEAGALEKHGEKLEGRMLLSDAALASALPQGVTASILGGEGQALRVRVSGQLFGMSASIEARVEASEGKLVVVPNQPLLSGLAKLTLFANPRLEVLAISGEPAPGHPGRWLLRLRARLR